MRSRPKRAQTREEQTRDWARCVVRSGLLGEDETAAEVRAVIANDLPHLGEARDIAERWISEERVEWAREAFAWTRPTDFDRIQTVFAALREQGYLILEGCADHWAARDALLASPSARGILWFVPADVWHAIDEPMLEINLWHPSTANAAVDDEITREVLGLLAREDLKAVFDEGRIEVAARWQRVPG